MAFSSNIFQLAIHALTFSALDTNMSELWHNQSPQMEALQIKFKV